MLLTIKAAWIDTDAMVTWYLQDFDIWRFACVRTCMIHTLGDVQKEIETASWWMQPMTTPYEQLSDIKACLAMFC